MKKVLLLNGPNLNMLGIREPGVYGNQTLACLEEHVVSYGRERGVEVTCFQSNSEGDLVSCIHQARLSYDGIIYNPGAHTHYSYALRDALGSIDIPCVEVHISDVDSREAFRRISVIAPACVAQVKGRGFAGYCDALDLLCQGVSTRLGEGFEARYAPGQVIIGGQHQVGASADDQAEKGESGDEKPGPEALSTNKEHAAHFAVAEHAQNKHGQNDQEQNKQEQVCSDSLLKAGVFQGASANRLQTVRSFAKNHNLDVVIARTTSDIRWACAFDEVFDDEQAHALVISADKALLHTDSRYSAAAQSAAAKEGLVEVKSERVSHARFAVDAAEELSCEATPMPINAGKGLGSVRMGFENTISLQEYRGLESAARESNVTIALCEQASFFMGLRARKDAAEIERMKAAQAITDAAFAHIVSFIKPGITEREVQLELEDFMVRHGASGLAFSSIVATGANGASPHAIPGATKLEAGQCVVLDFGARAQGYCSDMTRTVFLGEPNSKMKAAYEAIRSANEQVEAFLKPGVTGQAAHNLAESVLAQAGFAGLMGHGLGHGVGLDIHELPVLSPRNTEPLESGNVVTVEPGIYIPGEFGMRLEDFGVITDQGFEVFTQSSHELLVL